jgi:ankyrin repeat protein
MRTARWVLAVTLVSALSISIAAAPAVTLLDAAEAGDRATVLRLLGQRGTDPNQVGPDGTTAVMYAAHYGDLELVQALIKARADVKLKNQFGTSALHEASIIGSAPIIDALLKAGADANSKNNDGETVLMAAARSGKVDAAKRLLDAGANINATESWGGQTAVMWAAARGQADMVKFLASKGADLNIVGAVRQWERKILNEQAGGGNARPKDMNKGGFTALLYAAREGCAECAKNLLAAKADPDIQDPDGATPLVIAIMNQNFDTAAELIKGGADLDRWDLFGRSPIYMAADLSTLPMKGNGANAVIPSEDKLTALDIAAMLLHAGANPNLQLKRRPPMRDVPQDRGGDSSLVQGATAMMRAAKGGDYKFVEVLLKYKANPDLANKDGSTPLMLAVGLDSGGRSTRGRQRTDEDSIETIKVLLKGGANPEARNLVDRGGGGGARGGRGGRGSQMPSAGVVPNQTALHIAASRGATSFVEALVKGGANVNAKDADGRTPLDLTRGGGGGGGRGGAAAAPAAGGGASETAKMLESLGGVAGAPVAAPQGGGAGGGGGRGGRGGGAPGAIPPAPGARGQ